MKTKNKLVSSSALAIVGAAVIYGCGAAKDATNSVANQLSAALATFGVSSPSASGSAGTMMLQSIVAPGSGFSPTADTDASDVKSVGEKVEALEERLDGATAAACVAGLNVQFKNKPATLCFGSSYAVSSGYAFTGGPTSFNTTLGATGNGDYNNGGDHPGGDSGINLATEPGSTEACASSTTNAYVTYAAQGVSISQDLFAAALCLANIAGKTLPANGEEIDLLATVGTNVTGVTFTDFTLSKGTDGYTLSAEGTSSSQAFAIKSVNDRSGTTDTGKVFGYYNIGGGGSPFFGFSVSYTKTASDATVDYRSGLAASAAIVNMSTGALDYSAGGADMFFIKLNGSQSDATVDGSMLFAWQAGGGDGYARVFQSSVEGTTGEAYYGFGPRLTLSANENDYGEITGMICNWALAQGGDNQSTQITNFGGKAQKQTFTLTSGVFVPTANAFQFYPHPSCNGHSTYKFGFGVKTGGGGGTFTLHNSTSEVNVTASSVHELADIGSDGLGIPEARRP